MEYIWKFIRFISKAVTDMANVAAANTESSYRYGKCCCCRIQKAVIDMANVAAAEYRKSHLTFPSACLHLTLLTHSKRQGNAHFDCEYI